MFDGIATGKLRVTVHYGNGQISSPKMPFVTQLLAVMRLNRL